MGSRQGSFFQLTNHLLAYNLMHSACQEAVIQLVNKFNCLAYDWTVKDQ